MLIANLRGEKDCPPKETGGRGGGRGAGRPESWWLGHKVGSKWAGRGIVGGA